MPIEVSAWAAPSRGAGLEAFSFTVEGPGEREVIVEVSACGICHSDIHMIDDDWRRTTYPLVPGHEAVGRVVEVGRGVPRSRLGQRVGIGWQSGSCGSCRDCLRGEDNLCDSGSSLIVEGRGGFASHVAVDSRFAFDLPEGIGDEAAGPLMCGGATVYSALRAAGMGSGQRVGVIGIGGLGHLATQFASRLGNRVTVFTTSPDKAGDAARLGADRAVVVPAGSPPPPPRERLDILLNTVPTSLDWGAYLQWLDSDGTLSLVAGPSRPLEIPFDALLGKRRRVTASPIAGRAVMNEMLATADRFGVAPVVERYRFSEVNRALAAVRSNAVRYRAVLSGS